MQINTFDVVNAFAKLMEMQHFKWAFVTQSGFPDSAVAVVHSVVVF